jgi:hypothetical protein
VRIAVHLPLLLDRRDLVRPTAAGVRRVTALGQAPLTSRRAPAVATIAAALLTALPLTEATADFAEIAQALYLLPG